MYEFIKNNVESSDKIFLDAPNRNPLSFNELHQKLEKVRNNFDNLSINRSDPVAIVLPNGPDLGFLFIACSCFAISAPLNPNYSKNEFKFYLSDLKAKFLIVDPDLKTEASKAAFELGITIINLSFEQNIGSLKLTKNNGDSFIKTINDYENDTSLLLHTSGTTSKPKLVQLSSNNLIKSSLNIGKTLYLNEEDSCLNIMPLFHIHGLVAVLLTSLVYNIKLVCTSGFNALNFYKFLQDFKPSWYSGVPTMHQAILQRSKNNQDIIRNSPLRFIRSSSAPMPKPVLLEIEKTFNCPVIEAYGMTEASHQIASNPLPPKIRKNGTVGLKAGPEVEIMDETGNILQRNKIGEIVIKGETVIKKYANNEMANLSSFFDSWFKTGDLGLIDKDGYIKITGRIKEIINKGGEKISPKEIDDVLQEIDAIEQVVCFPFKSKKYGEEIGCAIVLKETMTISEKELIEYASHNLAKFKIPDKFIFCNEIPKGPTGKLQRIGLSKTLGLDDEQL